MSRARYLSELSTFGVGGEIKSLKEIKSIEELQRVLSECRTTKTPFFVIGKGSNCLFDDRGFNGVILLNRIDYFHEVDEKSFEVGAGFSFSRLGAKTARKGLSGLEFASGIPGSVGGAVYMNAGANGFETATCLKSVLFLHANGQLQTYTKDELAFSYRTSPFQKLSGVIISATFALVKEPLAKDKQIQIIEYRKKTQPLQDQSAGCIFRNPPSHSAGALIEQCGLKGKTIGGARISHLHGNFIVNVGNATAEDVKALISFVQNRVKAQTGIELKPEVRMISYDKTPISS